MTENIKLLNLENTEKTKFIEILRQELTKKFPNGLPENYGDQVNWGLLSMIENDNLDCYQLIYVNNRFWSGSGGVIRAYQGKWVYQGGFRAFADAIPVNNNSLKIKSYSHEYSTKYQIQRAIKHNCDSLILSFNEYNEKLFRVTRDYHLPKVFGKDVFVASTAPVMFNEVPQWLLTMSLK